MRLINEKSGISPPIKRRKSYIDNLINPESVLDTKNLTNSKTVEIDTFQKSISLIKKRRQKISTKYKNVSSNVSRSDIGDSKNQVSNS